MANYRIKVSSRNLQSSVHAVSCCVVTNRGQKEGVFTVEAESAIAAAKSWDSSQENAARKIPLTRICHCCRAADREKPAP